MEKPVITGNTINVPSSQEFLPDVDLFVEGLLRDFGADESIIADIAISVSEVVTNAMMHGNKGRLEIPVRVTVQRENNSVSITVRDEGGGFDPEAIDSPIADENLMKEVGRGIFIVRSLMDSVEINPSANGTEVVISKALS